MYESDVTLSADGYAKYNVTKIGESTYQDLDNSSKDRPIDAGKEYAFVNESIVKSQTTDEGDKGDKNYENV